MNKSLLTLLLSGAITLSATGTHAAAERITTTAATNTPFSLSQEAMASRPSAAEITHATQTAHLGFIALSSSRIAIDKATTPAVKQFAQFEYDEQTLLADIFKDLYPNMPDPELNDMEKGMIADLSSQPSGKAFEVRYVQMQITAHEKLLEAQNTYLTSSTYLPQRNMARLAKGMIEQHLTLLRAYSTLKR